MTTTLHSTIRQRHPLAKRWCRAASLLALLAAPVLSPPVAGQDAREKDALLARMKQVLDREKGPAILAYAEARKLAADLKQLAEDIEDYRKRVEKKPRKEQDALKLDATRANLIEARAKSWNANGNWPLMDTSENSGYAAWLTKEAIRGQRILVRKSASSAWIWKILVAKNARSDSAMRAWLKKHADDLSTADWSRQYPGANQAEAMKNGKVTGWEIHHKKPLYVGDANGGKDAGENYVLLKSDRHKETHRASGDTYKQWGPPRRYVVRGQEYDEVDSTGDD